MQPPIWDVASSAEARAAAIAAGRRLGLSESKAVRMRDIARLANVSVGTVSRVVNRQKGVGDDTRKRIERLIEENGYRAHAVARELSTGRSRTIGVVFPLQASEVVMHSTYPGLLAGLGDAAEALGYDLMLISSSSSQSAERLRDTVRRRRVDGMVLPAAGPRDRLLRDVLSGDIPTVLIGHRARHPAVGWVDSSHDESARELTSIMLKGGRRELVMLNGPSTVSACGLRARGFWRAVEDAGDEVKWASELRVAFDAEEARVVAKAFLSERARPSAVVCGNDLIALGVLQAAAELGLRVPDEIAVSGFDDRTFAATTSPPLSTVRMPLHQLGVQAADLLIAVTEDRPVTDRHIILPTELVLRDTTPRDGRPVVDTAPDLPFSSDDRTAGLQPIRSLGPAPSSLAAP